MKKKNWKVVLFVSTCLCLFFVGCDKNNNQEEENPDNVINATVRYEASVADKVNYKIRVAYIDENTTTLKEDIVESPWSYEMKGRKTGAYLYISTMAIPRNDLITPETTVTSKIYINGKLHDESTGDFSAIVQYILGTP